jgi:uncharacterized MAPEG superfamily protein
MMTADLTYLVWSVALTMAQLLIVIVGASVQIPLPVLAGNRETTVEGKGWLGRAQRAHRNILESLVLFAILVLVSQVSGQANATTALGAAIYFWARVAYAVIYMFGITWVRSLVFGVSMVGLVIILFQLI